MTDEEPQVKGDSETTEGTLLPLEDGDIHARDDGPPDAPALLLVHGSAASGRSWDALVPLLTASHRVIRIDLLGCGRSAKPDDGTYSIPDQGRRAGQALDRLGIERAVAVGHSSGGMVAASLAEQRPELVDALALVSTGPDMGAFIAPEPAGIGPSHWPPDEEQVRRLAATGFSRDGFRVPQSIVDDVRGMTFHSFAATTQAADHYLEQRTLPDRLADVGKPLLVIFGEHDRRWRSSSAADYRAVPGAEVDRLPGVGHSPILEDPPRTAELLLAFTARRRV
ncbi:alpha/beta fold hydrolase [Glycomyces xiaoerkulensis]|uniref:alpha/beta fold hydrolase n=1 Tax=Glycomyces xiaoerkulensis TaxID=2038139 RepID=UPI000C258070|nr:alpha/beta hydrolase [Glycomyces xiaoerkulensis]